MKATLYKLKEKYVLFSNEEIKEGDKYICISSMYVKECVKTVNNKTSSWVEDYLGNQDLVKFSYKILTQSPDFSELKEEDTKRIGWFDVEKIAVDMGLEFYIGGNYDFENGVRKGFQKALELTGRFTEEDIKQAYYQGRKDAVNSVTNKLDFINPDEYIQSLSQHWEVEYKEENGVYKVLSIK